MYDHEDEKVVFEEEYKLHKTIPACGVLFLLRFPQEPCRYTNFQKIQTSFQDKLICHYLLYQSLNFIISNMISKQRV